MLLVVLQMDVNSMCWYSVFHISLVELVWSVELLSCFANIFQNYVVHIFLASFSVFCFSLQSTDASVVPFFITNLIPIFWALSAIFLWNPEQNLINNKGYHSIYILFYTLIHLFFRLILVLLLFIMVLMLNKLLHENHQHVYQIWINF